MTNTYSISKCRLLMFVARKSHSEPLCLSWQNVIMKVLRDLTSGYAVGLNQMCEKGA